MVQNDAPVPSVKTTDPESEALASIAAAVAGVGVILALASAWRVRRPSTPQRQRRQQQDALVTYLREHLSGSDTALQVVERLRRSRAGSAQGQLFSRLFADFQRERDEIRGILRELGASPFSMKRTATIVGGRLVAPAADGDRGDLALFRTLEGLTIGVQGKRCLWRALLNVTPPFRAANHGRLRELEQLALRQWEALDEQRRSLVSETFASRDRVAAGEIG